MQICLGSTRWWRKAAATEGGDGWAAQQCGDEAHGKRQIWEQARLPVSCIPI
jgi:hypothetical protein